MHAINGFAFADSAYERRETLASIADINQSRLDFAAEQIIDAFDWKDARDALELAGKKDPESFEVLCESLAALQGISPKDMQKIEDRRVRDALIALDKVARFYAGHRAAEEVV